MIKSEGTKAQPVTHNIKQLGFSGLREFCSRISIFLGGYECAPKTQPFHIENVIVHTPYQFNIQFNPLYKIATVLIISRYFL
jgi:hypothetical protein